MEPRASEQVIELYERHALAWDADRGPRLEGERRWIARFLEAAGPGSAVLDIGCGSGEPIAHDLVIAGHPVTGVDSSASLIKLCRRRFPDQRWIVADMRTLDLGVRFGGVLAWHSFFHLTQSDQRKMFAIFAAHAALGAALMFTSGPRAGEAVGSWRGEPLFHASLDPGEYQALLDAHGFELIGHAAEDPACGEATIWLAKLTRAPG
jgi:SAM-dependent methyltransferase